MKSSAYLAAALLVHAPLSVYSNESDVSDCKRIANDAQRLACYDAFFQRDTSEAAVFTDGKPNTTEQLPVAEAGSEKLTTAPVKDTELRLVGDFTGWSGKTKFALNNGEVWQQTKNYIADYSPREPIPQPKVTISKGMFGSFNLRIDGVKRTVQVKRIR